MAQRDSEAQRTGGAADAAYEAADSARELALLAALKERLEDMQDLEISAHHLPIVSRQVRSRMALRGLAHVEDYLCLLDEASEERRLLRDALLIGSTSFFRDEEVFGALGAGALAGACRGHTRPIKVWVPGCSTGQEAYSLAIVLREYLDARGDARPLRMFATDLRESSVAHGRRGVYGMPACAAIGSERRARFFEPLEGGLRAVHALRDRIVWGRHDVLRDPPLPAMDLVSCRNVLLYFERAAQARILAKLHYALRPAGLLLLGAAESIRAAPELFTPTVASIRLYTRRARAAFVGATAVSNWGRA